jgi:pyruvate dehydrogenase E2 component (dihydrolipoamide acetyltransferase)
MITPTLQHAEKMSLMELTAAVSNISRRIGNTNINEMLYQAAFRDTVNELKKFNPVILSRILTSKFSRFGVKDLAGEEKKAYYKIPEDERLTEKDLLAGTVTVSNIGSLYQEQRGFFGLLEIIPPQVFAIGLGAVQEKPGVYVSPNGNKEIGIRKILPLCLVFDHRAVDFSAIVPFLKRVDQIFAQPDCIHAW